MPEKVRIHSKKIRKPTISDDSSDSGIHLSNFRHKSFNKGDKHRIISPAYTVNKKVSMPALNLGYEKIKPRAKQQKLISTISVENSELSHHLNFV